MLFERGSKVTDFDGEPLKVTPRRLAAAKAAITRKYNQIPPINRMLQGKPTETAEERVQKINDARIRIWRKWRSERAADWLHVRRVRRNLPNIVRRTFDCLWNCRGFPEHFRRPGKPHEALDLMTKLLLIHFELDPPELWVQCAYCELYGEDQDPRHCLCQQVDDPWMGCAPGNEIGSRKTLEWKAGK